jgi:cyclopropane fatty-acyl-phospholipid synthase-like methyltransferase
MDSRVAYWNAEAPKFDSIYREDGTIKGCLNRFLRRDMEGRYLFALKAARLDSRPHILEIGCGTGVHIKGFLESGASSVTGVDLSSEMLKIAAARLKQYEGRFEFVENDFMNTHFQRSFDVVTAIGVLDYVADALGFVKKAMSLTSRCFIVTFPRAGTLRSRLRSFRLRLKRCPVYFYSETQLRSIAEYCESRIDRYEIIGQLHCAALMPIRENGCHENSAGQ